MKEHSKYFRYIGAVCFTLCVMLSLYDVVKWIEEVQVIYGVSSIWVSFLDMDLIRIWEYITYILLFVGVTLIAFSMYASLSLPSCIGSALCCVRAIYWVYWVLENINESTFLHERLLFRSFYLHFGCWYLHQG